MTSDQRIPIAVSTLKEAEIFVAAGFHDVMYAVGIVPDKLDRTIALNKGDARVAVILDNEISACAVAGAAKFSGAKIPTFIEIDADGHRAGVRPDDGSVLIGLARQLDAAGCLRGVMSHSGGSYVSRSTDEIVAAAEQERTIVSGAADIIENDVGHRLLRSVGSTPVARVGQRWDGIDEIRAGVFSFFDQVMLSLGVCSREDLALSVVATVIGHQHHRGWTIVDAGWSALSRDAGTAREVGYGAVSTLGGEWVENASVIGLNQEHGIIAPRDLEGDALPAMPVGSKLLIYPNHACATATLHAGYHVLERGEILDYWPRFSGW
jgi:D-serine deaminase-like pyridoxal phosphate-dependent protein